MSSAESPLYLAQKEVFEKGSGHGTHPLKSIATLRILSDDAVMAVGVLANTESVTFGKAPQGAVIYPSLSMLSTDHTAAIAGKIQLVPLDGSAVQEIPGVTANTEGTALSFPDLPADTTVAKQSWVRFVPTSNTTIATSSKAIRLRLVYGQTY